MRDDRREARRVGSVMCLVPDGTPRRPLHIVFLAGWLSFPHGMAATNRVRLLARALVEAGAQAHVICMQASDRPPTIENRETRGQWHGVTFEYTCGTTSRHSSFLMRRLIEVRGWTVGALRLVQLRRAGRLDCVYLWATGRRQGRAQLSHTVFVGLLRWLGVPVVAELNERPWSLRDDRTSVEKRVSPLTGVAGVVSISSYLTEWARGEAARRGRRIGIAEVPILVDMAEQPPPRPWPQHPMVLFAGAPEYDSTVDFIVQAMELVWGRFPDCRLTITGGRPADPAAIALSRRLASTHAGQDDRLRLAGHLTRSELLDLYQDATALLIPLFDDVRSKARFPTKVGEYLASARPVISTTVGEMARYFVDGETAFLSRPGDARAYGERICSAVADTELARKVGAAGREVAREHFAYQLWGRSLLDLFRQVSEQGGTGARAFSTEGLNGSRASASDTARAK